MSIINKADMLGEFEAAELTTLTDRERIGQINDVVLAKAIAGAEDEATRKVKPIDLSVGTPSPYLKRVVCDIARYTLYKDHAPEEVYRRYQAAMAFLKDARANPEMLGDGYALQKGRQSTTAIEMIRG